MHKNTDSGFTLVEMVIVLVILAIVAAIAIPVTLSIVDSGHDAEAAMNAKSIWNASQSACNDQLATEEHWLGKKKSDNDIGLILDEHSRGNDKPFTKDSFEGSFIYVGDTKFASNVLSKIDNKDSLKYIYLFTGNYGSYFSGEDYRNAYTLYLIAFMYKDDDKMYFYDGNKISEEWPFKTPSSKEFFDPSSYDVKLTLNNKTNKTIVVQGYLILSPTSKNPATEFKKAVK